MGKFNVKAVHGTKGIAILLMFLCTLFTSVGQLLWKSGVMKIHFSTFTGSVISMLNFPFVFGFVAYGVGAVLMLVAFQKGELSVLFPIVATSFIWVSLFSPLFFPGDAMNITKWIGIFVILLSVSMLGLGSSNKEAKQND